jgi:hypothetical protein
VTVRQAGTGHDVVRCRALHGEDRVGRVLVGDLHLRRRGLRQPSYDLGGVGGVRHQQHVVVGAQVGDEVVDDPTGRVVAAQGVLGPARLDASEVVAQRGVDERPGTRSGHPRLAEVADVEEADPRAYGAVLGEHATGVLQRHLPAAELGELRAERDVTVVQRRSAWLARAVISVDHAGETTPAGGD